MILFNLINVNIELFWRTLISKAIEYGANRRYLSKVEYAPQSPEDDPDDRFVAACHMIEYVDHLLDVLMFAELEQRVKAVDTLLKDGTIAVLEHRLRRLEKEVQHHGEES